MTVKNTATATATQPVRDSKGRFVKASAQVEPIETIVEEILNEISTEVLIVEEIEPVGAKRGAKPIFEKPETLMSALRAIRGDADGKMPSRYHQHLLVDAGLVMFESIQTGKRGRPQLIPHLTADGVMALASE